MKYRVEWLHGALNELAEVWTKMPSSERKAITAAADAIDKQLSINPLQVGESRSDDLRIHFQFPLGISFEVDTTNQSVQVAHVWRYKRRGK